MGNHWENTSAPPFWFILYGRPCDDEFLVSIFRVAKCGKGGVVGFPRMVEGLLSLLHMFCYGLPKKTLYLLIGSICVLIVDT